jgi:oxygen-independent coproporphyrinogen-3 oxidase
MWSYHPSLLERSLPRYTSYPTAAEFMPVGGDFHEAGFDAVAPDTPASLYLHIPFCEKICWYCGCNTGAVNKTRRLEAYLDALHAEIELVAARLGNRRPITQIAFGGGSPNAIPAVDFVRLVDHLMIAFSAFDARLSIELDPRGLKAEWIAVLGRSGVSHASLGVQTFDPLLQERIGRVQPFADVAHAVKELRDHGISSLNFDLMYGLPGQTMAELKATIVRTIDMAPDRIALFGYAHLPAAIPRQRQIDASDMPAPRQRFDMAALGHRMFTDAGYEPVGFDHFARPGDSLVQASREGRLKRNFQGFTDDQAEALIGLGASAISSFPDRYVQNDKNNGRYRMRIDAGSLAAERGALRSASDRVVGRVIERILCRGEADIPDPLSPDVAGQLDRMRALGLIEQVGCRVVLTEAGRPYARTLAHLFDAYHKPNEAKFSNAI